MSVKILYPWEKCLEFCQTDNDFIVAVFAVLAFAFACGLILYALFGRG